MQQYAQTITKSIKLSQKNHPHKILETIDIGQWKQIIT